MKILMTGATGWVGKELGIDLVRRGHQLVCLVRDPESARLNCPFPAEWVPWRVGSQPIPPAALKGVDAVLHLMGEPVAGKRWTPEVKARIYNSRIDSSRELAEQVRAHKIPIFVSASAIGYYGDRGEEELTETSAPASGFLPEVCRAWEERVFAVSDVARCVALRIGIVLGRDGGALEQMMLPFQLGVGGPMGSGKQWMSWIHLSDLRKMIIQSLEDDTYRGVINAVAPGAVRQAEFAKILGRLLRRPAFIPAPRAALRLVLGEMAQVVLASQRVKPEVALRLGFKFDHPELEPALTHLLEPERTGAKELQVYQYVARPLEKVFPFYADEMNLERITPPFLGFRVLGKDTPKIQEGTLIDYRLSLYGIPFGWRTKILDWAPPYKFVDTQLKGPYGLWHHTHVFEPLGEGTLISDQVRYRVPFGALGALVAGWKVNRDVKTIFNFRRRVIAKEIWA